MTPADRTLSAALCHKPIRHKLAAASGKPTDEIRIVRLIAADIKTMVAFYETVTGQAAEWLAPQFAEIVTPAATLAIGSAETVAAFSEGSAEPGANRTAILEFMVDDVDAAFARLRDKADLVHEPKLLSWGNRSVQFRDPEGTVVSLFMPVTNTAKARFGSR